jgi:SAM-dependent methyltransferase
VEASCGIDGGKGEGLIGSQAMGRRDSLELRRAIERVEKLFPYGEFLRPLSRHTIIAERVMRLSEEPGKILDVGAGACVKGALLSLCGHTVYACDDLRDAWHLKGEIRERITEFAAKTGVRLFLLDANHGIPCAKEVFDVVMINDMLEHLHHSPYQLLLECIESLKVGGHLFITIPNAVSLRKRVGVLFGRTNYPPYEQYFWYPYPWRGHVREYVLNDLKAVAGFLGLRVVELGGIHIWVEKRLRRRFTRWPYLWATFFLSGMRDTVLLIGSKPGGWSRQKVEEARPKLDFEAIGGS